MLLMVTQLKKYKGVNIPPYFPTPFLIYLKLIISLMRHGALFMHDNLSKQNEMLEIYLNFKLMCSHDCK